MNKIQKSDLSSHVIRLIVALSLASSLLAAISIHDVQAAGILYSKSGGMTTGNCDSWTNACELRYALGSIANSGDEIWVQQGTYKPTGGTDRTATFQLINGVSIYGGFVGIEADRAQRDQDASLTILSGDIGTVGSNTDNSYHVVTGANNAILDGVTITKGHAFLFDDPIYNNGAGMFNNGSSPTVRNVIFSDNFANSYGAGMYTYGGNPTLTDVTFTNNEARNGGGGMCNFNNSSPSLTRVTFNGNTSDNGGGMHNDNSDPTIIDSTFSGNASNGGVGAGAMYNFNSSPSLTNVTFSGNTTSASGAGIYTSGGSPTLTDVTFTTNNATSDGGGMYNSNNSTPSLTRVTFSGNVAKNGGGMYSSSSTPTISEVTFSNNVANGITGGGGMYNQNSSPILEDVTFSSNRATYPSGSANGGGMKNASSNPKLTNVTFVSNSCEDYGGGMHNYNSSPELINVTFSGNSADYGGGISNDNGTPTLTNVILWDNTALSNTQAIHNTNGANPTLNYCVVNGGCPSGSTCNDLITTNPLLQTLADNGGFTQTMAISINSSAINTGTNTGCPTTDQRGISRPQGDRCDIGAFELDDLTAPSLISFTRQDPLTSPTSADSLTFRATFSEDMKNVGSGDFAVNGSTSATITNLITVDASTYDITVSGGDLASFNGTVGIDLSSSQDIQDLTGYDLPDSEPSTDETYLIVNSIISIIPNGGIVGEPGTVEIINGGSYQSHFTSIQVTFNSDANNPDGNHDPDDVTNPENYQLITTGSDGVFTSTGCGLISPDDVQIPTGPITYTNNSGAGPFVATVSVNNEDPLPSALYRLYICGSTSITNLAGSPINNGEDISRDFLIMDPVSAVTVPQTGFAPYRITALQTQTYSYAKLGNLWLEIPSLGIRKPIVGIPLESGTWDVSWLGNDIGWLNGSAFPTWSGNSVLTGHVYNAFGVQGPFIDIDKLRYGAQIIVHAWGGQYIYEVRAISQISPDDTAAMLEHKELPWLTLVTCRGYDEISGTYAYRVLVQAVQVDIK